MAMTSSAIQVPSMEDDQVLKRKTDCVYFLASPLTCKKGNDCEFRHNESARLNPRDCWYWLSGNCLNPSCPFRHPPLEGLAGTIPDSFNLPTYAHALANKSDIPCYFYFNSFCSKGDRCPFMHALFPPQGSQKQPLDAAIKEVPETKASTASGTAPASVEMPANPSGEASEITKYFHPEKDPPHPTLANILEEHSTSIHSSMPDCEEPAIKIRNNLHVPGEYVDGVLNSLPDQSSEELVKDRREIDEWWESSPGFDVLVDDRSDQLVYEDDTNLLLPHERETERLHGYDPLRYSNVQHHDPTVYGSYDRYEDRYTPHYIQRISEDSRDRERERERNLKPTYRGKRRPLHKDDEMAAPDGVDLRDHLRSQRRMDVHLSSHLSEKHRYPRKRHDSQEQTARHLLSESLACEVRKIPSVSKIDHALGNNSYWTGPVQFAQPISCASTSPRDRGSKRQRRQKSPPVFFFDNPKGSSAKESRSTKATADFTRPKSLAQIREEKSRNKPIDAHSGDPVTRRPGTAASYEFEGPKPELLRDKKSPTLVSENTVAATTMTSREVHARVGSTHGGSYNGNAGKPSRQYETSFSDEDDDDEDGLGKKPAHILAP